MSFFQIKWLRNLVRRNTRPIEHSRALQTRERLSLVYAVLAWNAFGVVCYMAYTGRSDWAKSEGLKTEEELAMSPGQQWAKSLNIKNAKVVQFSGLRKVNEFEIHNATDEDGEQQIGEDKP